MINKFLLIGAAVFLAALNAQARIGYTLAECVKQYGGQPEAIFAPGEEMMPDAKYRGTVIAHWTVGETFVEVTFDNKKVVSISYSISSDSRGFLGGFTETEINELYAKNGGAPLNLQLSNLFGDIPLAKANKGMARTITISTPAWIAKQEAAKQAVIAAKAKAEADERASNKTAFDSL
jgi:hypothetical protein